MKGQEKKTPRSGKWLDRLELENLTAVWATWARDFSTATRALSRSRLYLFFLLARYAGLRTSEILAFSSDAALDIQTGFLQFRGRKLFLPPVALRPIRSILSMPEAKEKDFLQLDAGFLRRTFYELGRLANLQPEACAPRALRYARAQELLALHMSPQLVAAWLGIDNPLQLARLAKKEKEKQTNQFAAIVTEMETDLQAGKIFLQTNTGLALTAIAPIGELADLEPACGKPVSVSISPRMLFPSVFPLPVANRIVCVLTSMTRDKVETRATLATRANFEFFALLDASAYTDFEIGETIDVYIPACALKLTSL